MSLGDERRKGIVFGDDNWATVVDEQVPYKDSNGIEMKRYLISPSDDLVDSYPDILKKEGALNIPTSEGDCVWIEYPTFWITDENPSRRLAIARIDCGYDGRETPLTRKKSKQVNQIRELQIENETFRLSIISLEEEKKELLIEKKAFLQEMAEMNELVMGRRRQSSGGDKYEE